MPISWEAVAAPFQAAGHGVPNDIATAPWKQLLKDLAKPHSTARRGAWSVASCSTAASLDSATSAATGVSFAPNSVASSPRSLVRYGERAGGDGGDATWEGSSSVEPSLGTIVQPSLGGGYHLGTIVGFEQPAVYKGFQHPLLQSFAGGAFTPPVLDQSQAGTWRTALPPG